MKICARYEEHSCMNTNRNDKSVIGAKYLGHMEAK